MKGSEVLSAARSATPANGSPALSRIERFRLDGPTIQLDRRVHAVRNDIADVALAGRLFAPHYASPVLRSCAAPSTMLRAAADRSSRAVSQLLRGEGFAVLDISGGWAWGYCLHDHYVGFVPEDALQERSATATHLVGTASALVFAAPDIKSPVVTHWPLGARFEANGSDDRFVGCEQGYLHRRHVRSLDKVDTDPVSVAERLVGTPYLWGGRAGDGIDCSGLVQLCLSLCAIDAPRDSDQQRAIGTEIAAEGPLRRGDLIFFPGHVGFMMDAERLIHANAFWMAVTVEPLAHVVARLTPEYAEPIVARRRIVS